MELHYSSAYSGDFFLAQRGLQTDLHSADFWLRTNHLSLSVHWEISMIGSGLKLQGSD